MERLEKIHIEFKHESILSKQQRFFLVKFNQKLKKAMIRYITNTIKQPLGRIRFFYKDKELTGNDSAESAGLENFCTINVRIENPPSK